MRALRWYGKHDVRVETVPDPTIELPGDVVVRVTATAICGSDLHLYNDLFPTLHKGDILGHEFMGEVVAVGPSVTRLKLGDRVVVPFAISCGQCYFCSRELYSLCDNSNPNEELARKFLGQATAGLFGYGHITGGFSGGQAEYVRVPYADVGPLVVPEGLSDEQVLFLSDILPTGFMAAENARIQPGDTVAVWGCGPVGQFTIQSAWMLGAGRVIAIDHVPERLALARTYGRAETIDSFDADEVYERLMDMTDGRGPASCIDAVGMEAHGSGIVSETLDWLGDALGISKRINRPYVIQQIIKCCQKGGTLSIPGVYAGLLNAVPMGAAMNKGLTWKMGQTHVHRYMGPLLERIIAGEIDPTAIVTHRLPLEDATTGYGLFAEKQDSCVKVVLRP
ncbi:Threonine dehydrogenase [Enhygromyxa salina]|uniref:Threonine dehydrogenase n=1 Tax=Enhygromyxa salina TaxID=215803 RepID=A0A0C2D077_9BACT|nr:zinc-dependent alcohol dehydrogenase [Enhygromyxa salina]KIG15230.1 Threonine dehydrogenase [Enhygromyxa salina]